MINKEDMLQVFQSMGQPALVMNHYDLNSIYPQYSITEWKEFLQNPEIKQYIEEEMTIIRKSEIGKVVQGASSSHSVGQAQLLTALNKLEEGEDTVKGPVFIYCHVPLNDEQIHAPNVREVDAFGMPINPET